MATADQGSHPLLCLSKFATPGAGALIAAPAFAEGDNMASASITRRQTRAAPLRGPLPPRRSAYPIRHAGSFAREREARARRDLIAGELAAGEIPLRRSRRL